MSSICTDRNKIWIRVLNVLIRRYMYVGIYLLEKKNQLRQETLCFYFTQLHDKY